MAEAVVNVVIEKLVSATTEWLTEEISMIKGVQNELHNMSTKMPLIQEVLNDAEKRSVRETFVQEWLDELQDVSYEIEDVLDEWNTIVNKLKQPQNKSSPTQISSSYASSSKFTCLPNLKQFNCFNSTKQLGWHRDLASRIKIINQNVDSLFNEMGQFEFISSKIRSVAPDALTINNFEIERTTTSLDNKSLIYGRDVEKEELLRKLCVNNEGGDDIIVVSIVGLGGLGKTTLAQLVYNDEKVIEYFEKRIWVCVSNTFDEFKVARVILEGLRVNHLGMDELDTLHHSVKSSLSKHKFLLVLDDVWNEKPRKLEQLRACLEMGVQGSKVLITTRSDKVARIMNTSKANMFRPSLISESGCWLLMSRVAFHGKGNDDVCKFENIGKEIAKKCKGLPLAAKTLGGLLILKDTIKEWKEVLNSEIWELEQAEIELFPHIFLIYKDLPPALKHCFIFFSIFPKDYEIEVEKLITFWIANGYINPTKEIYDLDRVGQEYCRYLSSRSLFQVHNKPFSSTTYVSMHDMMHDFALHFSRDSFLAITKDNSKPELTSRELHKSKKARHLFINGEIPFHVRDVGSIRTCLAEHVPRDVTLDMMRHLKLVRILSLRWCSLDQIPQEIGELIHLTTLDLSYNFLLKELPETVGDLYNLKYLFLEGLDLSKFPQSIKKLTNLRILNVKWGIWKLLAPESLGNIVNLKKLSRVHVVAGSRGLGFLKTLNQLHEDLQIVFESDYNEEVDANEAKLKSKTHIKELNFQFNEKDVDEVVFDALEAPKEVEAVKIVNFRGTKLPSWVPSLNYMTEFEVWSSKNIVSLPPLGKLPCLKKLKIYLSSLKSISHDFWGIDNNIRKSLTNAPSSSSSSIISFPALEKLEIDLPQLKKWEDPNVEEEDMTNVMPVLKVLDIQFCWKLEVMPLRVLLKTSPFLKTLCLDKIELPSSSRFTGEEVAEETIRTILPPFPNLDYIYIHKYTGPRLPNWISCLNYLTELHICSAKEVQSLPPLGNLPCLETLSIEDFCSLKSIGREFLGIDIEKKVTPSIAAAAAPVSSSSSIASFPKLKHLRLSCLYELKEWEDIKGEEDTSINLMPNLQRLEILQCPRLVVFPHRLIHKASLLSTLVIKDDERRALECSSSSFEAVFGTLVTITIPKLQDLMIFEFMDKKLPTWIASLNYLTHLEIYGSKNVISLPPLGKLPCLRELVINEFSVLKLVGQEFLGMEEDNNIIGTSITYFPKLQTFTIHDCLELEVWEDITSEEDVDDHAITVMPCLHFLQIKYCPKLEGLPHRLLRRASSLTEIKIAGCGIQVREKIVEDAQLLLRVQNVVVDYEYLKWYSEREDN